MMKSGLLFTAAVINAVLYAAFGYFWTVFPLTIFGISYWPQVLVPAVFAVLFGSWSGGVGAGMGIFIADMLYGHHDASLSLLVGVPSNFSGFFIIGWLTHDKFSDTARQGLFILSLIIPIVLASYAMLLIGQFVISVEVAIVVLVIMCFSVIRSKWTEFEVAASIGLGFSSVIMGFGLVLYSYMFHLPAVLNLGYGELPLSFAFAITALTYLSEILFITLLTPLVARACQKMGFAASR